MREGELSNLSEARVLFGLSVLKGIYQLYSCFLGRAQSNYGRRRSTRYGECFRVPWKYYSDVKTSLEIYSTRGIPLVSVTGPRSNNVKVDN